MKSLYLLDEILSAASPNHLSKQEALDALGVGSHQLWILTSTLRESYDRRVEVNHLGLRYPQPPAIPLWVEFLAGVTRLSRATKRIVMEDAIDQKVITVTVKRKCVRILPFEIRDDQVVVAAEIPGGEVARRFSPTHLDEIDAVVEIRKFSGDAGQLRRFLGC
jgi:hypothetical protein